MFPIINISRNDFNKLEGCSICCSSFNEGIPEEFLEDLPKLLNFQNALIAHNDENGKKHPLHLDCFKELRNHTFLPTCPNCRVSMNNIATLHIDTNTRNLEQSERALREINQRLELLSNGAINPTHPSNYVRTLLNRFMAAISCSSV